MNTHNIVVWEGVVYAAIPDRHDLLELYGMLPKFYLYLYSRELPNSMTKI